MSTVPKCFRQLYVWTTTTERCRVCVVRITLCAVIIFETTRNLRRDTCEHGRPHWYNPYHLNSDVCNTCYKLLYNYKVKKQKPYNFIVVLTTPYVMTNSSLMFINNNYFGGKINTNDLLDGNKSHLLVVLHAE